MAFFIVLSRLKRFRPMKSVILIALRRLPSVFLSLVPALLVSTFSVGAEGEPPASPAVAAAMQPCLDSYKLAGYIAMIADKTGEVHFRNIAGYADVEAKAPLREGNMFWIASMTKMFAGSIRMLVDQGKLSLDDPVTRFIPQLERWMVVEEKDQSHPGSRTPAPSSHSQDRHNGRSR